MEYGDANDSLIQKIGGANANVLEELQELHIHDFGVFIELTPDAEEKGMLENNIQTALSAGLIDLEDAIDIREVRNIKLANQLLKLRRKKKLIRDQAMKQQNIQAQAQANAQQQQQQAQVEMQKEQMTMQGKGQLEQMKAQLEQQKLDKEVEAKMRLMELEFQYNMKLKNMEVEGAKTKVKETEDRKDNRTKLQATQQSELIEQRQKQAPPKNFESGGNDILGGGFGLGTFDPK